jgi:hypothetical protein
MQTDDWNLDTAENIKVIKLLVREKGAAVSLLEYLSSISDLKFFTHASEMRFGDTVYFRGVGKNVKAVIVPTKNLKSIPRKHRSDEWLYLAIYCHPNDRRFDEFSSYETVSAVQYNI